LKFPRERGFVLDIGRLRASLVMNGYQFQGKVNDGAVLDAGEEARREVVDGSDLDQAIRELDLNEVSDDAAMQEKLHRVIWERRAMFKGLSLVRGMAHVSDVKPDAIPVVMLIRRLSPADLNVEEEMMRKLVVAGILEPCVSANASRHVFVPTKDFGLRRPGDFRGLNAQTVPDRYPTEDPKRHVEWFVSKAVLLA
jgi:hypothetical protein